MPVSQPGIASTRESIHAKNEAQSVAIQCIERILAVAGAMRTHWLLTESSREGDAGKARGWKSEVHGCAFAKVPPVGTLTCRHMRSCVRVAAVGACSAPKQQQIAVHWLNTWPPLRNIPDVNK
ncbi:hypothetical protein FI667_g12296, partial [Globisporangium splendens]